MIANNCTDVQPILCIADVKGGDSFDACSKEGYRYATIGGNHSRQALQELKKACICQQQAVQPQVVCCIHSNGYKVNSEISFKA